MAFPLVPVLAGIGAIGGLIQGNKAQKQQSKALNQQQQIANRQADLFNQTNPNYADALNLLRAHAGIGGFTPGAVPGGMQTDLLQSPSYRAALQQAQEGIGRSRDKNLDQFSFALGRRGLSNSNLDVAGRAAILADAGRQEDTFRRQQAIQAPLDFERRLGALLSALNPGLGGAGLAANIFGQQAALGAQGAAQAGNTIGSALQNFMFLQALGGNSPATPPIVANGNTDPRLAALQRAAIGGSAVGPVGNTFGL